MSIAFIVGAARSGTTSLLQLLALSQHVCALSEPQPNLNNESRELFEGRLPNPNEVLLRDVAPRVADALDTGRNYVEKQVSLVPFVSYLAEFFNCRFIVPIRDGREVVTSLMNWHNQMFPIVYQECKERADLGAHARKILAAQNGIDPFDYSLPRPPKSDPWHESWETFSRFEMVSWYWSYLNRVLFDALNRLPSDRYLVVDFTSPDSADIQRVYDFLGLECFDRRRVAELLDKRINSLEDRIAEKGLFPHWQSWSEERLQRFYDIAWGTMRELGFVEGSRLRPPRFGTWWEDGEIDEPWYEQIYRYRQSSHDAFKCWFEAIQKAKGIETVIDVGAGIGFDYRDYFGDLSFVGLDMSPKAVAWSTEHDAHPGHSYRCVDVIEDTPTLRADLVFSQGTIDNVYDIDAFLAALASMTNRFLYVANYRGYFAGMTEHRYLWDPKTAVCFNDISAPRSEKILRGAGFRTVVVFPSKTGREDISRETVIVAARDRCDPGLLMQGHQIAYDFKSYQVAESSVPAEKVIKQVNDACGYFSAGECPLANSLEYFKKVVGDLKDIEGRSIGPLRTLAQGEEDLNLAIRIDVDMDLSASLEMARLASKLSIPLTFFLCHTAAYYGTFADGLFTRHSSAAKWYRQLQQEGAEVGMHIDPLHFYVEHGVDGAEAVRTELAWLREQGLDIRGTTGHNAAPVYGAENFEIFAGRDIRGWGFFRRDWEYFPLGVLSERDLGLEYEGSSPVRGDDPTGDRAETYLSDPLSGDFVRDKRWFRSYILEGAYCRWGYDINIWILAQDFWVVSGCLEATPIFEFGIGWRQVRDFVAALPETVSVVFTLHPVYFGFRRSHGSNPS